MPDLEKWKSLVPGKLPGWLLLATLAASLLLLSVAIWRSRTLPRMRWVLRGILPFGLFVVWAILSTAWSPLKVVSLGQAGGLRRSSCWRRAWPYAGTVQGIPRQFSGTCAS